MRSRSVIILSKWNDMSETDTIRYTSAKRIVSTLLDIVSGHGVKEAVCSPGSRNIPLLIGIHGSDIDYRMVTDERSAAFIALGVSITSNRPVMLICTSGTALLNYAPAVAEAFYQGRPLIVVSADRPEEWIDQDDSQTIRQTGALRNIVKKYYDISDRDIDGADGVWYAERIFNDAMLTALADKKGPVHINIRMAAPLEKSVPRDTFSPSRLIESVPVLTEPDRKTIKRLAEIAVDRRIMLVAGFMLPDARTNTAVNKFRQHGNVVVMAETISNLHLPAQDYVIDTLLHNNNPEYPELIISIGGALVSRMLKEYLRGIPDKTNLLHWSVGYNHTTVDCFKSLTSTIECHPGLFISRLSAEMAHILRKRGKQSLQNDYSENVNERRLRAMESIDRDTDELGWSEARAFKYLMSSLPAKDNVCISNGTPIRYAQLFTRSLQHAQFCNRGVSGIDGSTSTAVGCSLGFKGRTWLISGDMSLSYDINGLHAALCNKANLNVIVISNGGGGIFRYIKSSRDLEIRDEILCRNDGPDIRKLADLYSFEYYMADNLADLQSNIDRMKNSAERSMLEVKVNAMQSAEILRRLLQP